MWRTGASSLAAVYLGVRELESGASDMVLVGGVDTMQGPFAYMAFSKTQALSPRGRCRTFDESADGIAISEGLAMVVLSIRLWMQRDTQRAWHLFFGSIAYLPVLLVLLLIDRLVV